MTQATYEKLSRRGIKETWKLHTIHKKKKKKTLGKVT